MNAAMIAQALGGHRVGDAFMARCPAHDDRTPSLSIRSAKGKVLVCCHAGCPQQSVLSALRSLHLWSGRPAASIGRVGTRQHTAKASRGDADRRRAAMSLWRDCVAADDTPVTTYLAARGLKAPVPERLRLHPRLAHPSGGRWPGMVALVTNGRDDCPIAVHRTFIARDGGSKAPVEPDRMMLGPCHGGAVRLAAVFGPLMVGEGIETCLAVMQATGLVAWAALSTAGLRTLDLPPDVREVIVLADGDEPGENAAQAAAARWRREGRQVRIARPAGVKDFNDLLVTAGPEAVRSAILGASS